MMRRYAKWSLGLVAAAFIAAPAMADVTGDFLVMGNQQASYGDSRRSITFYDTSDIGSGPMFSVFLGFEQAGNFDEISALSVDPATGSVYVLAFDSGTPGADASNGSFHDTDGDYDIYKIDFQSAYSYWATNFQGKDARTVTTGDHLVYSLSPSPSVPNNTNLDYVTFGSGTSVGAFDPSHSNAVSLPNVVTKIGEVNRSTGNTDSVYWNPKLEYAGTTSLGGNDVPSMLLIDDKTMPGSSNDPADAGSDYVYRLLQQVDTAPGSATSDGTTGGYNRGTTESWESKSIGVVNLDFNGGVPAGTSEPRGSAYYADSATGVRGMWVTESDGGGDDIAFLQIDENGNSLGYRPIHYTEGNATSFAMDQNPATDPSTNDGKVDKIFVNPNTGQLIIIESGYRDHVDGITTDDLPPAVITRDITSYDNGSGEIILGAFSQRYELGIYPDGGGTDSGNDGQPYNLHGDYSTYDYVNNVVYFMEPDVVSPYQMDIYALDLNTGDVTSYLNVDDSVGYLNGSGFDLTEFIHLGTSAPSYVLGDFSLNGTLTNGDIQAMLDALTDLAGYKAANNLSDADLLAIGDIDHSGSVTNGDIQALLDLLTGSASASGEINTPVPEPASLGLMMLGGLALIRRRRKA